jgi:hypothetical protein
MEMFVATPPVYCKIGIERENAIFAVDFGAPDKRRIGQ